MKNSGILNRRLAGAVALLGHTDEVVVCDSGMPIPHGCGGPVVVDVSVTAGLPGFIDVLDALRAELVIEEATAAFEVRSDNPEVASALDCRFPEVELVSHEALKVRTGGARLVVRTGEASPYANVVLRCGVAF